MVLVSYGICSNGRLDRVPAAAQRHRLAADPSGGDDSAGSTNGGLFMETFAASWETADGAQFPNPIRIVPDQVVPPLLLVWYAALLVFILLCVAALFVRFRRGGRVEREQIKWRLYFFGLFLCFFISQFLLPEGSAAWSTERMTNLLFGLGLLAMPLTIAVAILRYRRRKYDAEQVLARFAQTARDETDLDSLSAKLARVVQETMQPQQVSVWLPPPVARSIRSEP